MRPVYLLGTGMLRFGRLPDRGIKSLAAEAVRAALADAALDAARVEGVWFANSGWGMNGGQDCIRGQVALRPAGIDGVPIVNVENACAGGATALHGAWLAVASGAQEVALAAGAEKVFQEDRLRMFATFLSALDVEEIPALVARAARLQAETPPPPPAAHAPHPPRERAARRPRPPLARRLAAGPRLLRDLVVLADHYRLDLGALAREAGRAWLRAPRGDGGGHSPFMDVYAIAARRHMARHGTTQRQLAVIAAKNHRHGALNPLAQVRRELGVDDVLAARGVAYPLTVPMCAPVGDGAAAAIVCSEAFARKHGAGRAVRIRASVLVSGRARGGDEPSIGARGGALAYQRAGIGPGDLHVAEVHDATAFGELHQCEALGLCGEGEGGRFAESGATALGGRIPLNPSGGLEARGHPIAASGLAQVHELVSQLRGEAGARQIAGARLALCQNGGGLLGEEEAAMGLHVLEAPGKAPSKGA